MYLVAKDGRTQYLGEDLTLAIAVFEARSGSTVEKVESLEELAQIFAEMAALACHPKPVHGEAAAEDSQALSKLHGRWSGLADSIWELLAQCGVSREQISEAAVKGPIPEHYEKTDWLDDLHYHHAGVQPLMLRSVIDSANFIVCCPECGYQSPVCSDDYFAAGIWNDQVADQAWSDAELGSKELAAFGDLLVGIGNSLLEKSKSMET